MRCSVFGAISSHPASVPVLVIHILFVVSTTFSRAPRFIRPAVSQSVSQSVMAVAGSSTCALRRRCLGQTSVRSTRCMSSDFGWCCSQASCSSAPGCQKDMRFSIDVSTLVVSTSAVVCQHCIFGKIFDSLYENLYWCRCLRLSSVYLLVSSLPPAPAPETNSVF